MTMNSGGIEVHFGIPCHSCPQTGEILHSPTNLSAAVPSHWLIAMICIPSSWKSEVKEMGTEKEKMKFMGFGVIKVLDASKQVRYLSYLKSGEKVGCGGGIFTRYRL